MPFTKTQSILKELLPSPVFDLLYKLATSLYYAKRGIADWVWYRLPRTRASIPVSIIREVLPYTMVGRGGLIATSKVITLIEKQSIAGALVECGVARGGTAALMIKTSNLHRAVFNNAASVVSAFTGTSRVRLEYRDAWLFDSFEGLPEPTADDGVLRDPTSKDRSSWDLAKGYCLGTQEEVEDLLFNKFGFSRDKVRLVKGWFQDTLPVYREQVGDIAVLRVDGDWYESTKCCLENLYDQVVDGGYVILDDYALVGCKKAVNEFFADRTPDDYPNVILDGRGGGWFRRMGK